MIVKDKNCETCGLYNKETKKCSQWETEIINSHSQVCTHFSFKKEFGNLGEIIFENDLQELRFEYGSFRVADMHFPRYHTAEIYDEHEDWFSFTYYFTKKGQNNRNKDYKVDVGMPFGNLTLGRTLDKSQRKHGIRVNWEFDGIKYHSNKFNSYFYGNNSDEDGEYRFNKDKIKLAISLIEKFEETGDPWSLADICDVYGIKSEKYNTIEEY